VIQSREHPPGLKERIAVIDSSPMSRGALVRKFGSETNGHITEPQPLTVKSRNIMSRSGGEVVKRRRGGFTRAYVHPSRVYQSQFASKTW